jgi:hypothetical protein
LGVEVGGDPVDEYSYEWNELRKIQRRTLRFLLTVPVLFGVIFIVLAVDVLPAWMNLALGLICMAIIMFCWFRFIFAIYQYSTWPCPRCGEPFHGKTRWYANWINPFARRCLHCRLPRWAETDPDPDLQREFSPSRSESILKLGGD